MTVYFTHQSALAFWRWQREFGHRSPRHAKTERYAGTAPTRAEIRDAAQQVLPTGSEVHVSVPDGASLAGGPGVQRHRWSRASCRGSYVLVAKGVYVSTAELAYIQMASLLDLEHLIELGYELCGHFCYSAIERTCRTSAPLTSPAALARFAEGACGLHGAVKARQAARLVLAEARSPREAHASMILSLPYRLGGYGLRPPELNGVIVYDRDGYDRYHGGYLMCDLLWRDARVALEYESDAFHAGPDALMADSRRRNRLRALGYDVITLTNSEIKDVVAMDALANSIARGIGQRLRPSLPDYAIRKQRLRHMLLSSQARKDVAHLPRCED